MNLDPALASTTTDLVSLAGEIRAISSQAELDGCQLMIQDIKAMKAKIHEVFDPHVDEAHAIATKAHNHHRSLAGKRNLILAPLDAAEGRLKLFSSDFIIAEKEKIEAERARLLKIAQEKEEARRKAEADRLEAEAAALRKKGQAEAAAEAKQEAKQLLAQPVFVQLDEDDLPETPVLPKGMSQTVRYKAHVVDFALLPDKWKIADQKELDKAAQAMKERLAIPGVVAVKIDGIASRR